MGKGKEERVDELLEMADLMKEKYAHPYDLSGGQRDGQRTQQEIWRAFTKTCR